MRSFRSKPVGWRNESYRHYLASKGVRTKKLVLSDLEWGRLPEEMKKERPDLNPYKRMAKCDVCGVVVEMGDSSCPNCMEGQLKYLASKGIGDEEMRRLTKAHIRKRPEFGSVEWQQEMERTIREKQRVGESLSVSEKVFLETELRRMAYEAGNKRAFYAIKWRVPRVPVVVERKKRNIEG